MKTETTPQTVTYTLLGTIIGAVVGLLTGANIGGNWATSFNLGSLHGYEATGILGALIGALALGGGILWLSRRTK